jgi:hypothetical protein
LPIFDFENLIPLWGYLYLYWSVEKVVDFVTVEDVVAALVDFVIVVVVKDVAALNAASFVHVVAFALIAVDVVAPIAAGFVATNYVAAVVKV